MFLDALVDVPVLQRSKQLYNRITHVSNSCHVQQISLSTWNVHNSKYLMVQTVRYMCIICQMSAVSVGYWLPCLFFGSTLLSRSFPSISSLPFFDFSLPFFFFSTSFIGSRCCSLGSGPSTSTLPFLEFPRALFFFLSTPSSIATRRFSFSFQPPLTTPLVHLSNIKWHCRSWTIHPENL